MITVFFEKPVTLCILAKYRIGDIFAGSNFRVFHDTEPFHEYLTHEHLLSSVEFEQYRSKNEILTYENRISIKTRKLDTTKISRYTVNCHTDTGKYHKLDTKYCHESKHYNI